MQAPDSKHPSSRLALRRGIHRTRERELAAGQRFAFGGELPDPMGPPPTAAAIVRGRVPGDGAKAG